MKNRPFEQVPRPNVSQALPAQLPQQPPKPTDTPRATIPSGAIVLMAPEIRLSEWLMLANGTQTKKLEPRVAYVLHGAIVIDEMNLILPLAGNSIKTKG